jgi:hypothetical protein
VAERPLLRLPEPADIAPPPGHGGGRRPRIPGRDRQRARLGPIYRRLRAALDRPDGGLELRADPLGIAPDRAIVMEIAGSLADFHKAVSRIPGLEFLIDDDLSFAPDDDFAAVDRDGEPIPDRIVPGRRYVAMPSVAALDELLGLYELWQREERLPRGFTPWRDLFNQLKTLRAWGPQDRIDDDAVTAWREELAVGGIESVVIEAELWFKADAGARNDAIEALREDAGELGGEFITEATIAPIAYHAALLRLPVAGLQRVMAREHVRLVLDDQVMFLRPQAVISAVAAEPLPPEGRVVERLRAPLDGPPIAALLDGFPVQRHAALEGRITVEDDDGLEARATVGRRVHGTAMASLIVHGDLNRAEASLTRPLLVRPIMFAGPNDVEEHTDQRRLLIDTVHRAIVRLKDPATPGGPIAPNVVLVNLSLGDRRRPFTGPISPWARLLDHLAVTYDILILVSAGNILDDIALPDVANLDALAAMPAADRLRVFVTMLRDRQGQRTLLSPSEGLNPLTIGAVHADDVAEGGPNRNLDPYPDGGMPMISSAVGLGHRRVVKPDLLLPGGRQRLRFTANPPLTLTPMRQAQGFGLRVASPDTSPQAALDRCGVSFGTSPATALATRAGHQIFDALMDEDGGSHHHDIDAGYYAVLLKALLVHAARWPETAAIIGEVFGPADWRRSSEKADNIARILGYGIPDVARVLECSPSQATLAGCGSLAPGTAHAYRIPLPECLAAVVEPRRFIVTLAWMSPITTTHQEYRRAQLQLDAPELGQRLGVRRAAQTQPSDHASKRGSVLHEIYEGDDAVAFIDDGFINVRVWCGQKPATRRLDAAIKYGLALTIEAGEALPIYMQVDNRLRAGINP